MPGLPWHNANSNILYARLKISTDVTERIVVKQSSDHFLIWNVVRLGCLLEIINTSFAERYRDFDRFLAKRKFRWRW